ncbi:hypothetical protein DB346_17150 [Verrucomicrobia bacterium LW23]|nr:hypothetical protein DB346_17150 [Verrucomicrobia bacterium LW23]
MTPPPEHPRGFGSLGPIGAAQTPVDEVRDAPRIRRWYECWEFWVLGAITLALLAPAVAWVATVQICVAQLDREKAAIEREGMLLQRPEEYDFGGRRAQLAASSLQYYAVRHSRLGAGIASRALGQEEMMDGLMYHVADHYGNMQSAHAYLGEKHSVQEALGRLRYYVQHWQWSGGVLNLETVLPPNEPYVLSCMDFWLYGLDDFFYFFDTFDQALNRVAMTYLVMGRTDDAVGAWVQLFRRSPRQEFDPQQISPTLLLLTGLAIRSGQLDVTHYQRLLDSTGVRDSDCRTWMREMVRHTAAYHLHEAMYYRDPDYSLFAQIRADPLKRLQKIGAEDVLPRQRKIPAMLQMVRKLRTYYVRLEASREKGSPIPAPDKEMQRELASEIMEGIRTARGHNVRMAALAFGLWRLQNGGRLPELLSDFMTSEIEARLIPVEGERLHYFADAEGRRFIAQIIWVPEQPDQGASVDHPLERVNVSVRSEIVPLLHLMVHHPDDKPTAGPVAPISNQPPGLPGGDGPGGMPVGN